VWVNSDSRGLLLDFPVSALTEPAVEVTPSNWWTFLNAVAARGLGSPSVPLPEHARALLARLTIPAGPGPVDEFVKVMRSFADRPVRVTSLRRSGPPGMFAILPALMVAMGFLVPVFTAGLPVWYQDLTLNAQPLVDSLRSARGRTGADSAARRTAEAIQLVLARDKHDAGLTPQLGKPTLDALPSRARAEVDSAALRFPSPDAKAVADARAWLRTHVPTRSLPSGSAPAHSMLVVGLRMTGYVGILGVLLALALRGGLLLTMFGIAVQRPDGTPASRLRCFARSVVAWAPLLILAALGEVSDVTVGPPKAMVTVSTTAPQPQRRRTGPSGVEDVLVLLALGGAAFAVWRPTRGIAERVAGVVLVPK